MSSFTDYPSPIALPPTFLKYKLIKDLEYHVGDESSNEVVIVPEGFISDAASIPKFAWSIIGGPLGRYAPAAFVHDYLYRVQVYTRKKTDRIFLEAMEVLKIAWWKRRLMWVAVRIRGFMPWNDYKRKNRRKG